MRVKFVGLMAALLLVAACESTPDSTTGSTSSNGGKYGANGTAGVNGMPLKNPNATPGSAEDFTDNVGDRVFFDFDSSEITAEGRATLDRQAEWLKTYSSVNIVVEGHCDERGTREYNLALGERRANAAKQYLVAAGIPAARLDTVSYGKERPEATGHDDEAWAQNRRAVSTIK